MGTNYYIAKNTCSHCGRHETEHIGKASSFFHFQGTPEIRCFERWLANVKTADRIFDQFENDIPFERLLALVTHYPKVPLNKSPTGPHSRDRHGNIFFHDQFS